MLTALIIVGAVAAHIAAACGTAYLAGRDPRISNDSKEHAAVFSIFFWPFVLVILLVDKAMEAGRGRQNRKVEELQAALRIANATLTETRRLLDEAQKRPPQLGVHR